MYRVEYFKNNAKFVEIFVGNRDEIYKTFSKEGKVVLKIKKIHSVNIIKYKQLELAYIFQALSDILTSGMSLSNAIDSLVKSISYKSPYKQVFLNIKKMIESGKSFPEAIQGYSVYFGETAVQMLKAGYNTGDLSKTLNVVSQYLIDLHTTKKEILKKLSYPVTVFMISLLLLIINTRVIIPKLLSSELFKSVLISSSPNVWAINFLKIASIGIPLALIFFVGLIFVALIIYRINQKFIESKFLRLPLIRELLFYRAYFIGFFSMSKLLSVGIRLSSAFEIVSKTISIKVVRDEFESALKKLKKGEPFVNGFKTIPEFDKQIVGWSLNVDKLSKNFEIVARRFYDKYISAIRLLSPLIYTISLVMVMGIFLLTFFSVFVPYLKLMMGMGN